MSERAPPPTFKIGLSLAGAVSAGAYTAGVLDFLLEALDCWTAAQARDEPLPRHRVSLETASGASAGAMCAALLAIVLPYRFPHVRIAANGELDTQGQGLASSNPLYRAWVETIDIQPLLATADLDRGEFDALLNCDVIDAILHRSLLYSATPQSRPYVTRPFVVRFALGNLRGVPYRIDFRGNKKVNDEAMTEHADYQGFLLGGDAAHVDAMPDYLCGHARLAAESIADLPQWQALGDAAIASGAFPLFLKPRLITRDAGDYGWRHFAEASTPSGKPKPIPPAWADPNKPPAPYSFASVDAGMYNNEPFELVREVIAGGPGCSNPRDAQAANGAVLMVAPFMSTPDDGPAPQTVIDPVTQRPRLRLPPLSQILPLIGGWIMQSRFNPLDLAMAYDESVYSRFVIAPTGSKAPEASAEWIASGTLQGFLGFFHEDFRKHDFQLGRRNCQQFLREHFTLPADNPIVREGYAGLDETALQRYRNSDGQLPIIPLLGAASVDEGLMDWPADRFTLDAVMPSIEQRLDALFRLHRAQALAGTSSWLARQVLRFGLSALWSLVGRAALKKRIAGAITAAIQRQAL
ncbi:MAG: patatin [Nevskia sp.]|nr:patatin [Nevskia sp.]